MSVPKTKLPKKSGPARQRAGPGEDIILDLSYRENIGSPQ